MKINIYLFIIIFSYNSNLLAQINNLFDSTFGLNGVAYHTFSTDFSPKSIIVASDNKIIVAGNSSGIRIAKYNENGLESDLSFGNFQGSSVYGSGFGGVSRTLQLTKCFGLPNDQILMAGISQNPETSRNEYFLMRLNSDGSLDNTFGTNGLSYLGFVAPWNSQAASVSCLDAELSDDGFVYYAGLAASSQALVFARCSTNGSWDLAYGTNGFAVLNNIIGIPQYGFSLQIMPVDNNKLFVLTSDTYYHISETFPDSIYGWRKYPYITQLTADGNVDSEFNSRRITPNFGLESNNINAPFLSRVESETIITSLIRGMDNKLYASVYFRGGWQEHISEDWNSGVFSFSSNGDLNDNWIFNQTIDAGGGLEYNCSTFGMSRHSFSSEDDYATCISQLPDGTFFLSGYENPMATDEFTSYITKLQNNGMPFTDFNEGNHLTFSYSESSQFERFIDASWQQGKGMIFLSPIKVGDNKQGFFMIRIADIEDKPTKSDYNFELNQALVYPNPTNDLISIRSEKRISRVEVRDIKGNIVISRNVANNTDLNFNLFDFAPGIYFVYPVYANYDAYHKPIKIIKF
ncbi:MAG: T9SS type A sorting domain-containing protein [Flavobacteriales bacterium]